MQTFDKIPLDWANECVASSPTMKPTRNQIACTVRDALQSQHEHVVQLVKETMDEGLVGNQRAHLILDRLGNTPKS